MLIKEALHHADNIYDLSEIQFPDSNMPLLRTQHVRGLSFNNFMIPRGDLQAFKWHDSLNIQF